jgi:hypothetical protein
MIDSRARRLAFLWAAAALLGGCEDPKALDPDLGRVRPARPTQRHRTGAISYVISPESVVEFELPRKATPLRGRFRGPTGRLEVHLDRLAASRGSVTVDLLRIDFDAAEHEDSRGLRAEALSWLGLGSERPDEERRFRQSATLTLTTLEDLQVDNAFAGRVETARQAKTDGGMDEMAEARTVDFTARGDLTLNARRTSVRLALSADFRFPEPALTGALPEVIHVQTRRPTSISLSTFDVLPRDARGHPRPSAREGLGDRALLSTRLVLRRAETHAPASPR